MSINWVARWLGVNAEQPRKHEDQVFVPDVRLSSRMLEAIIPTDSPLVGKALIDLGLPRGVLVVHIQRGDTPIIPGGGTVLHAEDHLLVLATPEALPDLEALYERAGLQLVSALVFRQRTEASASS
jgi:potassium/hydrogen antiporter